MRRARFLVWAAIVTATWGLTPERGTSGETTWSIGAPADALFIPCVFGCKGREPCKWGCGRPAPRKATSCEAMAREFQRHYEWRVGYNENKDRNRRTDRNWVAENTWNLLRRDMGRDLDKRGFRPGTANERCFKGRVIALSAKKLDEHVKYWKNPNFFAKAGDALHDAGKAIGKVAAMGFEIAKKVFCNTIGMPICQIVDLIKTFGGFIRRLGQHKGDLGKTLLSYWEDFKANMKRAAKTAKDQIEGLFQSFKEFLTLKDDRQFGTRALAFAKRVFTTVETVTKTFTSLIGLPEFLGQILGWINGGTITAALSPAVIGLAAVNLGARKLFEWLLPELILGVGALANKAERVAPPKGFDLFQTILDTLKKVAGPVAGGLIGILVKDPKKKARIKAVLERIGGVAGKVEKALSGVLSLSRKMATGKFEEIEKALASASPKRVPTQFTPKQLGDMIDGLIDFAKDEVWALLNPKLRDLLGKGMSLLDKLFDIPRGIVIAAVGSIPFAGGVLSSALNFGLGLVVDIVKGFLIDQVMGLAEFILKDVMDGLKGAFRTRFFAKAKAEGGSRGEALAAKLPERERRIRAAVRSNPGLAALATAMGDAVEGVRQSLKTASLRTRDTMHALVTTAMKDVMLRGVASVHLREMVTAAVGTIASRFTNPGFTLAKGVGAVLSRIEVPLGQLLGDTVQNPQIRQVLLRGLAALVRNARTGRAATRLGRSAEGVFGRLGADLIDRVRPELVALLIGKHENHLLREIVVREVNALARIVRREGFGSLLRFGELFRRAVSQATRPLAVLLVAQLDAPARHALGPDMDALASQVAAEVQKGPGAGRSLLTVIAETAGQRVADRLAHAAGGGRP